MAKTEEKEEEIDEQIKKENKQIKNKLANILKLLGESETDESEKISEDNLKDLIDETQNIIEDSEKDNFNINTDNELENIEKVLEKSEIHITNKYSIKEDTDIDPKEMILMNNVNKLNRIYNKLIKKDMEKNIKNLEITQEKMSSINGKIEQMSFTIIGFIVSFGITSGAVAAIPKIPTEYIVFVIFTIIWAWMTLIYFISSIYKDVINIRCQKIYKYFTIILAFWTCMSVLTYYISKEDMKKAYDIYKNKIKIEQQKKIEEENQILKETKQ